MRLPVLIITLAITSCSYSQSRYSGFIGGVEFGYGVSTIIDFNRETNGLVWHSLLLNLPFHMPFQFGFFANKYVNNTDYLEYGLVYAKRGAAYIWQELYYPSGSLTILPSVNLYCVDIPIKFYKSGTKIFNETFHSYFGVIPSLLYSVEMSEMYYDISDKYYNNAYLSICTGISHQKGNRRLKMQLSTAVTSITKHRYKAEIQVQNDGYKGVIFPCEAMLIYGFVIE